jgi:integrase
LELAGLPVEVSGQPITAHATRRSFATWLSDQGVEESTIALLLGHAGSSTVARHYSAATIERLYKAISRIELCASIVPSLVPGGHKEK